MSVSNNLKTAAIVVNIILVIGFLGLVWLLIFGNIGEVQYFELDTASYGNETITLGDTAAAPSGAAALYNSAITSSTVLITNATGGEVVASGNYTLNGIYFTTATVEYNGSSVNVSYSATYDPIYQENLDRVVLNYSSGLVTFYGYAPTWFIITAITILVAILMGLLWFSIKILKLTQQKSAFA